MKTQLTLLASGLALLLLGSCSKQETPDTSYSQPGLIRITTGVDVTMTTKGAITSGTFPTSRSMYVAAYHNSSSQNHFTSTLFSYTSGGWTADKSWPLSGTLDFLAYSPGASAVTDVTWGSSNATTSVQMAMPDNSSTQEDILFGCAASQSPGVDVVIDFKHPQAYLVFTAKASESYNSTTNRGITINSITLKSAKYSGTILANRTGSDLAFFWSSLGSAKTLAVPGLSSTNLVTSSTALGNGILLPEQTEVGFIINYTLHNGKDSAGTLINTTMTYDYTPSSPVSWQAGKKYTYGLDITMNGITITPTVALWATGANKEINL